MTEHEAKRLLVLTTSNTSMKYLGDAFQVLAWPKGWVMHFRYEMQYVDNELRGLLPSREEKDSRKRRVLHGDAVLAAYAFQKRDAARQPPWRLVALYPLRSGEVVDAYKTGELDHDVAHFYFKLDRYWDSRTTSAQTPEKLVDFVADGKNAGTTTKSLSLSDYSESAGLALIDQIAVDHLTHEPDRNSAATRQYYPIWCYLRGLRKREANPGRELTPQVKGTMSFYDVTEREDYWLDFSFHLPAQVAEAIGGPAPESSVTLRYDKTAFASEPERRLTVASRYDEQFWLVSPATTERDSHREISLSTALRVSSEQPIDAVDMNFTIPVAIRQNRLRRVVFVVAGLIGDFGLALGTIALAVGKAASPPNQPATTSFPLGLPSEAFFLAVVGYGLLLIFKFVAGFWKP